MGLAVKVGDRTVTVGDTVQYKVPGDAGYLDACVLDVADGATNTLNLRLPDGRVVKRVPHAGTQFGTWRVKGR